MSTVTLFTYSNSEAQLTVGIKDTATEFRVYLSVRDQALNYFIDIPREEMRRLFFGLAPWLQTREELKRVPDVIDEKMKERLVDEHI